VVPSTIAGSPRAIYSGRRSAEGKPTSISISSAVTNPRKIMDEDTRELIDFLRYSGDVLDGDKTKRGLYEEFDHWR